MLHPFLQTEKISISTTTSRIGNVNGWIPFILIVNACQANCFYTE